MRSKKELCSILFILCKLNNFLKTEFLSSSVSKFRTHSFGSCLRKTLNSALDISNRLIDMQQVIMHKTM